MLAFDLPFSVTALGETLSGFSLLPSGQLVDFSSRWESLNLYPPLLGLSLSLGAVTPIRNNPRRTARRILENRSLVNPPRPFRGHLSSGKFTGTNRPSPSSWRNQFPRVPLSVSPSSITMLETQITDFDFSVREMRAMCPVFLPWPLFHADRIS